MKEITASYLPISASTGFLLSDIHETKSAAFKYKPCGSQCLFDQLTWGKSWAPRERLIQCEIVAVVCVCLCVLGQRGLEVIHFYIFRRNTKRVRERERKGVKVKDSMTWLPFASPPSYVKLLNSQDNQDTWIGEVETSDGARIYFHTKVLG